MPGRDSRADYETKQIESQIEQTRGRIDELNRTITDLQTIIEYNSDVLAGKSDVVADALARIATVFDRQCRVGDLRLADSHTSPTPGRSGRRMTLREQDHPSAASCRRSAVAFDRIATVFLRSAVRRYWRLRPTAPLGRSSLLGATTSSRPTRSSATHPLPDSRPVRRRRDTESSVTNDSRSTGRAVVPGIRRIVVQRVGSNPVYRRTHWYLTAGSSDQPTAAPPQRAQHSRRRRYLRSSVAHLNDQYRADDDSTCQQHHTQNV
ncbi:hypothetical protein C8039_07530 [Halogeometricum sp. wsp3]|nr:hypothetical protein C8039_07530 [Halogeometricum sp. wsp3]